MREFIQRIVSKKSITNLMFDYMNLVDEPYRYPVKREDLLFGAWLVTGNHLRKALKEYGKKNNDEALPARR